MPLNDTLKLDASYFRDICHLNQCGIDMKGETIANLFLESLKIINFIIKNNINPFFNIKIFIYFFITFILLFFGFIFSYQSPPWIDEV